MGAIVLAFISATFVLAGFVKGVVGVGLPTIAMGLLATVMSPAQAAALLTVPSFITNVWQASGPQLVPLLRRIWPMLVGICGGTWAMRAWGGAGLLTPADGVYASLGLGPVLLIYAFLRLTPVRLVVPPP